MIVGYNALLNNSLRLSSSTLGLHLNLDGLLVNDNDKLHKSILRKLDLLFI